MARWATDGPACKVLNRSGEQVEHITLSALQPNGTMLCDYLLNRSDFDPKTQEMNTDIVEANYNQKPIDVKGRLNGEFGVYEYLPAGEHM